jgi:ankyrin repeat protein
VEYLIERGTKIDAIDADDWTPLHYACAKGHLNVIKFINLKETKNFQKFIRMKTNTSATCLHLAVQQGNVQSVEYILTEFHDEALKILVNEQAEPFGTPLHIAGKHFIMK